MTDKKTRLFAIVLATAMLTGAMPASASAAVDAVDGNWDFNVSKNMAKITGYSCTDVSCICIPAVLGNCPVTEIDTSAFLGCDSMTGVIIPDTVTTIGNSAFCGCAGLSGVMIPEGVKSIGYGAFKGCMGLTKVTFKGNPYLNYDALPKSSGLTVYCNSKADRVISFCMRNQIAYQFIDNIPEVLTFTTSSGVWGYRVANKELISYFGNASDVKIPVSFSSYYGFFTVEKLGSDLFKGNTTLSYVKIPSGITNIGNRAFYRCSSLKNLEIEGSEILISGDAFYGCDSLENVTMCGRYSFSQECKTTVNEDGTVKIWILDQNTGMAGSSGGISLYAVGAVKTIYQIIKRLCSNIF